MMTVCVFGKVLVAQQDTHFSLYRHHMTIFNPAVTGLEGNGFLKLSTRNQWIGEEQAPRTQAISFGTPLGTERIGLGFNVINDATFVEDQTSFFVNFSYKLQLNDSADLFLGIQAGGNTFRINASSLRTIGSDGIIGDPFLIDHGQFNPNVGVGIYIRTEKGFLSLSAPRILSTKRFMEEDGFFTTATDRVHSYISLGRQIAMSENWTITPYFMSRFVNDAPIFHSFNTNLTYDNGFDFGLEYHWGSGFGANLMIDLGSMSFGYAYTHYLNDEINQSANGSHELLLKVMLGSGKGKVGVVRQDNDIENDK